MIKQISRKNGRMARARRVRAKIFGTAQCPRLSVFRSLRNVSVQVIDDVAGRTLVSGDIRELGKKAENTVEGAFLLGRIIGEKCTKAGVASIVFDRAGYRYHGKVKAVADGAREAGLKF
jgi:large subunit ribosomal protein L18